MRKEIKEGYIEIAYGYNHSNGHFLSVRDTRLQFQRDAPAEVNEIANQVKKKQGFSGYFELYTGMDGIGFHTDLDTLVHYWALYGVPNDIVERAREGLLGLDYYQSQVQDPTIGKNLCLVCGKTTTQRCTNCGALWACGPEHAKEAWKKHKPECQKKSPPPKPIVPGKYPIEYRKGYLLKEDATALELVDVEVEIHPHDPEGEGEGWDDAYRGICNHLQTTIASVDFNRSEDGYSKLVVYCADSMGGLKLNRCVGRVIEGKPPRQWAGPLLLMRKYSWESNDRYGHVNSNDVQTAIEFFWTYGLRYAECQGPNFKGNVNFSFCF